MRSTSATQVSFLRSVQNPTGPFAQSYFFLVIKSSYIRRVRSQTCLHQGLHYARLVLTYQYRPWSQVYCSIAVRVLDLKPTKRRTLPAASPSKLQASASKYEYLSDIQRAEISVIAPKAVKPVHAVPLSKAMPIMPMRASTRHCRR